MKEFSTFHRRDAWRYGYTKSNYWSHRRPCPVLGNADSGRRRYAGKFVEEAQKSAYLLNFSCMHAQLYPSSGGRRSRDNGDPPSGVYSAGPTRNQNWSVEPGRGTIAVVSYGVAPVQVAHIYPHYLLAASTTNLTRTYPPLWKMLEYF